MEKPLILAVDDEAGNLQLLHQILGDDYRLLLAKKASGRWRWRAKSGRP